MKTDWGKRLDEKGTEMKCAQFGDRLEVVILGTDPDGIPDAVRIEYFRGGRRIRNCRAFTVKSWAALRSGALKLVSQWWEDTKSGG